MSWYFTKVFGSILNSFNLIQSVVAKFKIDMTMAMGVGIDYISGDGD